MHVKWLPDGDGSDNNLLSQQQTQSQHPQNQQQLQPNQHQTLIPNGHIFPPMSQMPPTHFTSQVNVNIYSSYLFLILLMKILQLLSDN